MCLSEPHYYFYKLPEWFDDAELEDQAALILNAINVHRAAIAERDIMLRDCEAWIDGIP